MKLIFLLVTLSVSSLIYGIEPDRKYIDHPANSSIVVDQVSVYTVDNVKLNTWVCMPETGTASSGVLVLAYGFNGNMSYYTRQVLEMVKQGFAVVMFDYRGFGESQDFESDELMLYNEEYTNDLIAVLQYTKQRFDSPVGVWGLSFGTITATLAYEQQAYDYLIADSYVYSIDNTIEVMQEFLNKKYLVPASAASYAKALSSLTLPTLFFNGDRDGLTSANDSYRMKYLNPLNELVLYRGLHMQGFQSMSGNFFGEKYIQTIQKFLMKF